MDKLAYHTGVALAFSDAGYSPDMIKEAFVQSGMDASEADMIVKEAFWGAAARGILGGAQKLWGASRTLSKGIAKGFGTTGTAGKVSGGINRAGNAISTGMYNFAMNPVKTTWGGIKNFGQGAMMFQGKGVGGALGKGLGAYHLGSMATGG